MNEKQKTYMKEQKELVITNLTANFNLPIFEDEISEDEITQTSNYFLVVYGDMHSTNSERQMYQEVYVVYVSENNPDVEETTVDIVSTIVKVKGFTFNRTVKERLQKDDTDAYVDQVTIIFKRKLLYEC
jgi:hypothetical protein